MRHRTPVEELELRGSKNVARAKSLPPKHTLAKRKDIEALYEEVKARRAEAMLDVNKNGLTIRQEHSNSRGMIYYTKVVNPALKIAQQCEKQLTALARLLVADDEALADPNTQEARELQDLNKIFDNMRTRN